MTFYVKFKSDEFVFIKITEKSVVIRSAAKLVSFVAADGCIRKFFLLRYDVCRIFRSQFIDKLNVVIARRIRNGRKVLVYIIVYRFALSVAKACTVGQKRALGNFQSGTGVMRRARNSVFRSVIRKRIVLAVFNISSPYEITSQVSFLNV